MPDTSPWSVDPRRAIAVAILSAALLLTGACGAGADDEGVLDLQIGSVSTPDSLLGVTAGEFARRVNERLAGRARVTFFGSNQLGNDEVMLQKLRLGTLDFSMPSTVMSSAVEEFGLFEMPYLVRDREHMNRIEDEIFWPVLAPAAEARGYKILAVWENGFRQITNNVRPIRVPADLAGIKLRTPRGDWRVRLFQAFGANPTPMPLSEVFVALQTGVIDGQENPLAQIDTNKFQEVQAYLSMTNHVYTPTYLAAGVERWERLPADVRAAIEDTARGMEEFIAAEAARMDREILEAFRAAGLRINQADRDSFLDASRPIYAEFASEVPGGEDMIATAIRLANP